MSTETQDKIKALRALEDRLMEAHREEQAYKLETFGERDFDPDETTLHETAALALSGLLYAVETLSDEARNVGEGWRMVRSDRVEEIIAEWLSYPQDVTEAR